MNESFYTYPSNDEIEVALIGIGGGYGESVVLKFNSSEWIIIDSCVNPTTKKPLSIEYLEKIGVNPNTDVKFIICTHWHNDHILGLSKTLEACSEAKFCIPRVNDTDKFLRYVGFDCEKNRRGSISSLNEFGSCIDIAKSRNTPIKKTSSNDVLLNRKFSLSDGQIIDVQLFSLSPSDSVVNHFDHELSTLLNEYKISNVSVIEKTANEKSVALYLKYKDQSALLGADLEVGKNENEGWKDVVKNSEVIDVKSLMYKVPHHASENGYEELIYNKLIGPNAILKITPWNRKGKLPTAGMLEKYKQHSSNLYITSPVLNPGKPKKRDKQVDKLIDLFSRKVSEVKFEEGIIRTRHNLVSDEIKTQTFGNAFKID